jgi:uncharacterized protein with HEPN domain
MHDEDRVRLQHMIEAAESAVQFVSGRARADLDTDRMLQFAVIRAIEIIGEAASKITAETRAAHSAIPWKAIVGMRNRLIHAYFDINSQMVWETVTVEIPAILDQLRALTPIKPMRN